MTKKDKPTKRHYSRKRKGISHRPKSIPVLPVLGLVDAGLNAYDNSGKNLSSEAGIKSFVNSLSASFIGYNPTTKKFSASNLEDGALPVVLGIIGHKAANKLGINRFLTAHKSPLTL